MPWCFVHGGELSVGEMSMTRNVMEQISMGKLAENQILKRSPLALRTVVFSWKLFFCCFSYKKAKIEKILEGLLSATRLAVFYDSPLIMT
jgi:hypothetical protein